MVRTSEKLRALRHARVPLPETFCWQCGFDSETRFGLDVWGLEWLQTISSKASRQWERARQGTNPRESVLGCPVTSLTSFPVFRVESPLTCILGVPSCHATLTNPQDRHLWVLTTNGVSIQSWRLSVIVSSHTLLSKQHSASDATLGFYPHYQRTEFQLLLEM